MSDAPDRIWIDTVRDTGAQLLVAGGVEPLANGTSVEYVRADIAAAREAELRAEIAALKGTHDEAVRWGQSIEAAAYRAGLEAAADFCAKRSERLGEFWLHAASVIRALAQEAPTLPGQPQGPESSTSASSTPPSAARVVSECSYEGYSAPGDWISGAGAHPADAQDRSQHKVGINPVIKHRTDSPGGMIASTKQALSVAKGETAHTCVVPNCQACQPHRSDTVNGRTPAEWDALVAAVVPGQGPLDHGWGK